MKVLHKTLMRTHDMASGIESFLNRILPIPGIERGIGATENQIQDAERQLGLKIPPDYRAVLRRAGWLGIGPQEFWGLGPDVPDHLDLVISTQLWRTNRRLELPDHLLPIQEDGSGSLFCLDSSRVDCVESPVLFFADDADPGDRCSLWCATLVEFIQGDVEHFLAEG